MSRQKLRRVGAGVGALTFLAAAGVAVWWMAAGTPSSGPGKAGAESAAPEKTGRPIPSAVTVPAYDLAAIDADPEYYATADAVRFHQSAPAPAGGHPPLLIKGDPLVYCPPSTKCDKPLAVVGKPGRPTHWIALDGGEFSNGDMTISVKADENGLAQTHFIAANPGRYRIMVSSPENAGKPCFVVCCLGANELRELRDGTAAKRHAERLQGARQ
jgi:hypothetical protein